MLILWVNEYVEWTTCKYYQSMSISALEDDEHHNIWDTQQNSPPLTTKKILKKSMQDEITAIKNGS